MAADRPPSTGHAAHQRGLSLISLMCGLLLSVLGTVSLLGLYRSIVGQSVQDRQTSSSDGSFATATLTAQMELQNAGFGIGSSSARAAVNVDLVMLSTASWSSNGAITGTALPITTAATASGSALVWGSQVSSTYQCSALVLQNAGLMLLRASGSCTAASQWATLTWTKATDLIPAGGISSGTSPAFRISMTSCWPYGIASVSALQVTIWDDTSAWKTSACLTNLAGA